MVEIFSDTEVAFAAVIVVAVVDIRLDYIEALGVFACVLLADTADDID